MSVILNQLKISNSLNMIGGIYSSVTEAIRIMQNNGYISIYNTANDTRTGYIQGNTGSNLTIAAENGASLLFTTAGVSRMTINTSGVVSISSTTASSSTTTGALVVSGGVGIAGNTNIGGNINVSGSTTVTDILFNSSGPSLKNSIITKATRQGLIFDGTSGATIANVSSFGSSPYSFVAWIKLDSLSGNNKHIFDGANCPTIYVTPSGAVSIYDRQTATFLATTSSSVITAGVWYHVVYSRTAGQIYINGLASGSPVSDTTNYSGSISTLGKDTSTNYFNGTISGPLIYNRSLSASEAITLFELGAPSGADYNNASNTSLTTGTFTGANVSSASSTGFTYVLNGAGYAVSNYTSFVLSKGQRLRLTGTVTLNGGKTILPQLYIDGTSSVLVPITSAGAFSVDLTCPAGPTGYIVAYANGDANYTISGLTVTRIGLLLAPDAAQAGSGLVWYDASGKTADITLPASGVLWNVQSSRKLPASLLHLSDINTNPPQILIQTSNSSANGSIFWRNSSNSNTSGIASNYNISDASGNLEFLTGGATTRMTINSSGNVGIGLNPTYKLDVAGAGSGVVGVRLTPDSGKVRLYNYDLLGYNTVNLWLISNGAANQLTLGTSWDWDTSCDLYYTPNTVGAVGGSLVIGQTNKNNANFTHGNTIFYTNGAEKVRVTRYGTLIVGDGASGDLSSTWWNNGIGLFGKNGTDKIIVGYLGSSTNGALIGAHNSALSAWAGININASTITFRIGETAKVYIDGSGNLGVGTTSPTYKFEISGTAGTGGVARIGSTDYTTTTVLSVAPGVVNFDAAGIVGGRLKIDSSGNVGIGITSPTALLDVNGSFKVKALKTYVWSSLSASTTQARRYEIARLGHDVANWDNGGVFEVELCNSYYMRAVKKRYMVSYGYPGTGKVQLIEYQNSGGDNNFQVTIGTEVVVSGNNKYLPVYVDIRYYTIADVSIKTNWQITSSSTPATGYCYINEAPSPSNISDFTADSSVYITSVGTAVFGGNITFLNDQTAYFIAGPANGGAIRIRSNSAAASDRNIQLGAVDNNAAWTSYLTVAEGGTIGIGITNPDQPLAFVDSLGIKIQFNGVNANGYQIGLASAVNAGDAMMKFIAGETSAGEFGFYNTTNLRMLIDKDGKIGIGTTSPTYKLVVNSTTDTQMMLDCSSSGFTSLYWANAGSEKAVAYYSSTSNIFRFGTIVSGGQTIIASGANAAAITLDSSQNTTFAGKITISSTTDSSSTTTGSIVTSGGVGVAGNIRSASSIYADGNLYIANTLTVTTGSITLEKEGNVYPFNINVYSSTQPWHAPRYLSYRSRGTKASQTGVQSGDEIFSFQASAMDTNGNVRNVGNILLNATGTVSGNNVPTKLIFQTCSTSAAADAFIINSDKSTETVGSALIGSGVPYGLIPTSGTTTNAVLSVISLSVYPSLYFGISDDAGTGYPTWIQAADRNNLSVARKILLNPRGGNILVGKTTDAANGVIQVPGGSSTAGIGFGSDCFAYSPSSGAFYIDTVSSTNIAFKLVTQGTVRVNISNSNSANCYIDAATTGGAMYLRTNGTTTALTLDSSQNGTFAAGLTVNGSLGVGTAASGTTGEIRATNNITAYYSDERLKTKLGPIKNPIQKVKSLSGFYFSPNNVAQALGYKEGIVDVGVSAQEVNAILPEIIAPAPIDPKYMTVRYEKLIPLLIEAIKEQQSKIEELENKLSDLDKSSK